MAQAIRCGVEAALPGIGRRIERALTGSAVTKWLDKELPEVRNTRADMLGETAEGDRVHLEFHSDRCRLKPRFQSPTMDFRFRVVDLSKWDGEPFLKSGSVGDRILAILMKLRDKASAIRSILESIAELDGNDRSDALRQLLVLSGLRGLTSKIHTEVEKMPVLDDILDNEFFAREYRKGIEKGIEQGIGKGEAKLLHLQIGYRFKRVPKWAQERLASATPDQLEGWGKRLLNAPTLRDVFESNGN